MTDATNAVLYSGGNTLVGPNGGGLEIATASDPGAYANGFHTVVQAPMPGAGCYKLPVVDDAANGINNFGFGQPTPFVRLRNPQVGIIAGVTGNFGSNFVSNIEIAGASGVSENADAAGIFVLMPNPVGETCTLFLSDNDFEADNLLIFNAMGEKVSMIGVDTAKTRIDFSVAALPTGMYDAKLLGKVESGNCQIGC